MSDGFERLWTPEAARFLLADVQRTKDLPTYFQDLHETYNPIPAGQMFFNMSLVIGGVEADKKAAKPETDRVDALKTGQVPFYEGALIGIRLTDMFAPALLSVLTQTPDLAASLLEDGRSMAARHQEFYIDMLSSGHKGYQAAAELRGIIATIEAARIRRTNYRPYMRYGTGIVLHCLERLPAEVRQSARIPDTLDWDSLLEQPPTDGD